MAAAGSFTPVGVVEADGVDRAFVVAHTSGWDDVAFDVSLRAVLYHPVVPRLTAQSAPPGAPPRRSTPSS